MYYIIKKDIIRIYNEKRYNNENINQMKSRNIIIFNYAILGTSYLTIFSPKNHFALFFLLMSKRRRKRKNIINFFIDRF